LVVELLVQNNGVSISNTILAGTADAEEGPDCLGVVASLGHNLVGIDSGCDFKPGEGDSMGTKSQPVDPKLGSLGQNGGLTATMVLLPDSPAIDASGDGSYRPLDQRGVSRPRGASCDIASYER